MKKIMVLLIIVLGAGIVINSYAQESVSKEVLLTTLNSFNKLKLSNLKTEQLMDYNKGFVDKVFSISENDKSDKDKEEALKVLSNDTSKDLIDLLDKGTYNKYAKLMEEAMKPLIKKSKFLKYLY